jgi:Ca2+-binding EF-hand superfamily protein
MKTVAVSFIASQLPEKEIEKLSALFRQLDLNHDGFLSIEELRVAFERQKERTALV